MKKKSSLIILLFVVVLFSIYFGKRYFYVSNRGTNSYEKLVKSDFFRDGDIIFQESQSSQSMAIQKATKSKYSHCGIIYKDGKDYYVFEAVQPVKRTALNKWISRGKDKHYVVKRLKDADSLLTTQNIRKMKDVGKGFYGKSYDLTFEWSDDKIYCSELIWKIYKRALNIELGKLQKLEEFDLSDQIVKKKLKERYGNNIPQNETVISPVSIFESNLLYTVQSN